MVKSTSLKKYNVFVGNISIGNITLNDDTYHYTGVGIDGDTGNFFKAIRTLVNFFGLLNMPFSAIRIELME